jgi:hypothetical protein
MKNAGVRRVAIILSVRGSRKIDEMAPLPSVVKCLRLLRRGEVGRLILPFHEAEVCSSTRKALCAVYDDWDDVEIMARCAGNGRH